MGKTELLKRLKTQIALMKASNTDKATDILCSRKDMLSITNTDNMFRAADIFYGDEEVNALLGFPERKFVVLPEDDGLRIYKALAITK